MRCGPCSRRWKAAVRTGNNDLPRRRAAWYPCPRHDRLKQCPSRGIRKSSLKNPVESAVNVML
ncbi:recombinase zinc beta ribbon domain-containing protein [Paraburkholderia fungorum]|uniref:recombinase zinc beta ribbon domain-containing protein n=1 Tax=Paraburkholderia fungorum TaxID=134537 RepID=UPI00351E3B49